MASLASRLALGLRRAGTVTSTTVQAATFAAARAVSEPADGTMLAVPGRDSVNDGLGGAFAWDSASTAADDNENTLKITGVTTGRWVRISGDNALTVTKTATVSSARATYGLQGGATVNETNLVSVVNGLRSELELTSRVFNVKAYGATGDGVTNDRAAFALAIAAALAAGGVVYVPAGRYLIGSQLALPANCSIVGASQLDSVILCGFDGTLFTCDDDNRFAHLTFDGHGATYTSSKLFTVAGTKARQRWTDCALINAGSYCLEYLTTTAGSQSTMVDCRVYRYDGASAGRYAIKIADAEQITAVPRKFIGCESDGGKFADLGGCANLHIFGGYIGGLLFSSNSRGVICTARIADPLGTTIDGFNHIIQSDIAGPVGGPCLTIAAGAAGNKVASIFNSANPVLDNSTAYGVNVNQVDIPVSTWTPTVTSSGAAVNLGAGAVIRGQYVRSGTMVHVDIDLTWGGAGLSVPVGFLEFSIPASIAPRSSDIAAPTGSGYAQQGGSTKLLHAVALPVTNYVRAIAEGGGFCTNINPFTWATGDVIRLSITYVL